MPGALTDTRCRFVPLSGPYVVIEEADHVPCRQLGFQVHPTTRPAKTPPPEHPQCFPVLLTVSPSLINRSFPNTTIPTLSGSKFSAIP